MKYNEALKNLNNFETRYKEYIYSFMSIEFAIKQLNVDYEPMEFHDKVMYNINELKSMPARNIIYALRSLFTKDEFDKIIETKSFLNRYHKNLSAKESREQLDKQYTLPGVKSVTFVPKLTEQSNVITSYEIEDMGKYYKITGHHHVVNTENQSEKYYSEVVACLTDYETAINLIR